MNTDNAENAISEVARILRKNGRLVASISHPSFDNGSSSGWLIDRVYF